VPSFLKEIRRALERLLVVWRPEWSRCAAGHGAGKTTALQAFDKAAAGSRTSPCGTRAA